MPLHAHSVHGILLTFPSCGLCECSEWDNNVYKAYLEL
jgi:hypothetical protein